MSREAVRNTIRHQEAPEAKTAQQKSVLEDIERWYSALLAAPPSELSNIPVTQGVYLIRNKDGKIIYVGKAKNLKRRICDDHRGGDEKMSTSTFRRAVSKAYEIRAGRPVREWVIENCSFAFVGIPDPDLRTAVEAFAILLLRRMACRLLNS